QVWAHQVGTPQSADVLVFQEDDDSIFVDVGSTKDQRFVTINGNSLSSSEVRILDAGHDFLTGKLPELTVVAPRSEGVEYYVDHHDDHYYILTNDNPKKNFRVMRANRNSPGRESWVELMEAKDGEKIEDVDIFKNFMVIYAKRDALPVISCYHFETGAVHEVPLPEQFCTISAGVNLDYETDSFQFTLNSPYAHEATYEYDMASRVMTALRVHPIHRMFNMQLNGRNPTLMRAYGAYGVPTDIDFRVEHFPLLERGWIIALAHRNTFTDFINVAEHLVEAGYTNPRRLTASGVSAGGLLVGAVCNMRPDLFRAMVLNVPFLDPMTTMLDPEIPLTKVEYLEWGNPAESEKMYDYMASYAPYDTIPEYDERKHVSMRPTTFPPPPISSRRPALMISCGERDQRVDYTQSTKFVARLRSRLEPWYGDEGKEACVLMIDENRGHFGNGTQDDRVKNWAREVVFLLSNVQMEGSTGDGSLTMGNNSPGAAHSQGRSGSI
ncbi:prolyl oligopeptidase family-domain-containing protein, partial [Dissophora ornata]